MKSTSCSRRDVRAQLTLGPRDIAPPAMLVVAVALGLSGVLDRPGLEGLGDGLLLGAAVCAPIWLLGLWRRSRSEKDGRA